MHRQADPQDGPAADSSDPAIASFLRLSSLGHQVGLRILSLLLLRNIYGNASSLKVRPSGLASMRSSTDSGRPLTSLDLQDPRKEHRLIPTLQFIHTQVYRAAFGRPADSLEKSFGGEDECTSPSPLHPVALAHLD